MRSNLACAAFGFLCYGVLTSSPLAVEAAAAVLVSEALYAIAEVKRG